MTLSMVGSFGMDEEAGLINYEVLLENKIGNNDELVKRAGKLIDGFYEETMDIVTKNIDRLQKLAAELLEKEMLEEKEINEIILQD
jgi:cell division protease FtsH